MSQRSTRGRGRPSNKANDMVKAGTTKPIVVLEKPAASPASSLTVTGAKGKKVGKPQPTKKGRDLLSKMDYALEESSDSESESEGESIRSASPRSVEQVEVETVASEEDSDVEEEEVEEKMVKVSDETHNCWRLKKKTRCPKQFHQPK